MHLHPLLVENHDSKELSDNEVDIKVEYRGFLGVQGQCLSEDPLTFLKMPYLGCSKLTCADKKMWETWKMCTCRATLLTGDVSGHELKHCRGWIH